MRAVSVFVVLLLFWAALSGWSENHNAFLVGAGVVSSALVTALVFRTELLIRDWTPLSHLRTFVRYLPWLMWQIVVANVRVIRIVWSPGSPPPIAPILVEVRSSLKTGTGRALYANSITLTPGTVTVDVSDDRLLVHALTPEDGEGLLDGAMQGRIVDLEPGD